MIHKENTLLDLKKGIILKLPYQLNFVTISHYVGTLLFYLKIWGFRLVSSML